MKRQHHERLTLCMVGTASGRQCQDEQRLLLLPVWDPASLHTF
jgi:hypothetical protein